MGAVSRRVPRAGRDRNAPGCRCHGHYGSRRDAAHRARDGAAAPHSPGARGDRRDDPHGGAVHLRCAARAARGAAVRLQDARRVSRRGCRQPAGVQPQRRQRLRPLCRKGRCDRAGVSRGDRRCRALRELFGLGTVWGQEIAFLKAHAVASLQKPMGGFLVYAIVAAIVNALFPAACAAEEEPGFAGVAAGTAEGGNE